MKKISSLRVVFTSFLVDFSDIILNVVIALMSGSVVMLATALRGIADLLTTIFLLIGLRQAKRRANKSHQFGYGRELYFWAFLASMAMLTITGGYAMYYGWQHFIHPQPVTNIPLSLAVLSIGVIMNGYALSLGLRRLKQASSISSATQAFFYSDLIEVKITFVLDLMGTVTALLGILSLALFQLSGDARFDGAGAMMIALTVIILGAFLVREVKDLLVGRSALPQTEEDIKNAAMRVKGVKHILAVRTMYIGSERLLVNMEVAMHQTLTTNTLEQIIDKIKTEVRHDVPAVKHVQVELETDID